MKMVSLTHKEVLVVSCNVWDTCVFGFCTRVEFSVLVLKKKKRNSFLTGLSLLENNEGLELRNCIRCIVSFLKASLGTTSHLFFAIEQDYSNYSENRSLTRSLEKCGEK